MVKEQLDIIVESVELTRDLSGMFSEMSPFVEISFGNKKYKTQTKFDGGMNPQFNKAFELGSGNQDDVMDVKIYNEGMFSNDEIASCQICVDQLKIGTGVREEFKLLHDAKLAGMITIQSKYQGGEKEEEEVEETGPPVEAPMIAAAPAPIVQPVAQPMMPYVAPMPMVTPQPMMQQPMMQPPMQQPMMQQPMMQQPMMQQPMMQQPRPMMQQPMMGGFAPQMPQFQQPRMNMFTPQVQQMGTMMGGYGTHMMQQAAPMMGGFGRPGMTTSSTTTTTTSSSTMMY